jgi:hypothetical protein
MSQSQEQTSQGRRDDPGRLAKELQALPRSTTRDLRQRLQKLIGTVPPGALSRDLLTRVTAYQLQEAALGGLPPSAKRRLAALTRGQNGAEAPAGIPTGRLKPGAKLVRAWRGKTHTVLVLEDGFEHQGRCYASLNQIAGEVTGAHWSGPRFFGIAAASRRKRRDGSE